MIHLKLFFIFAKIGLFGFGGGVAMLPLIYQGVQEFGLMEAKEFSNLVAISQVTPGPIAVNAATYVGYNSAGILGALSATLGVATPSFILVILACYFIEKFNESTVIKGAFLGIRPATVGLLAAAVVFMGQSVMLPIEIVPLIILIATIILIAKFKISPIVIVLVMGVIGALLCG